MTAGGSTGNPTPSGTRDVLPDEMRELRAMTRAMVDTLDEAGYGEVRTPSVEYERALAAPGLGPEPAYRFIDEHGDGLVLRSDMTVPIARIAATRYAGEPGPLRLCYLSRSWRRIKPLSGEPREILQVGGELIGGQPDESAVELIGLLGAVLDASGLHSWRIALGHSSIAGELMGLREVGEGERDRAIEALDAGDMTTLRSLFAGSDGHLSATDLAEALTMRFDAASAGGPFDVAGAGELTPAMTELHRLVESLSPELRERIIIDFSLRPRLGYHEGLVFEVYDPAVGRPLGGGGRYDGLLHDLGRPDTAIGFALDTELMHEAFAGEQRGEGARP